MPSQKISELTEIAVADSTDELVVQRGPGAPGKFTVANLSAGISSSPLAGAELFRWNQTDASQFGPGVGLDRGFGAAGDPASAALDVVDSTVHGLTGQGNALRVRTVTPFPSGCVIYPITGLTLPERYIIYFNIISTVSTDNCRFGLSHQCVDTTVKADMQGSWIQMFPFSNKIVYPIFDGLITNTSIGQVNANFGTILASTSELGGLFSIMDVRTRLASNLSPVIDWFAEQPSTSPSLRAERNGLNNTSPFPEWAGEPLNTIGIGLNHNASISETGTNTTIIGDLRVYAHPLD